MNKHDARIAIATQHGAEVLKHYDPFHVVVRFRESRRADECKAILDALNPGFTGEIFMDDRLLIANPELHEEDA